METIGSDGYNTGMETVESHERGMVEFRGWVFPAELGEEMRSGAEAIVHEIKEFQPDAVVALKRKGALIYPAVEAVAQMQGVKMPESWEWRVGRELYDTFPNEPWYDWGAYDRFLTREAKKLGTVVAGAVEEARARFGGRADEIHKVYLVDDFNHTGTTFYTARKLLQRKDVLGQKAQIRAGAVFQQGWDRQLLQASVPLDWAELGRNRGPVMDLLLTLMTGENERGHWGATDTVSFSNWEQVRGLGEQIAQGPVSMYRMMGGVENPAMVLKRTIKNPESLLEMGSSLRIAVRKEIMK